MWIRNMKEAAYWLDLYLNGKISYDEMKYNIENNVDYKIKEED